MGLIAPWDGTDSAALTPPDGAIGRRAVPWDGVSDAFFALLALRPGSPRAFRDFKTGVPFR